MVTKEIAVAKAMRLLAYLAMYKNPLKTLPTVNSEMGLMSAIFMTVEFPFIASVTVIVRVRFSSSISK